MHRTQIYLTQEEADALDRLAAAVGTTRSGLIRQAIDERYLPKVKAAGLTYAINEAVGAWVRAARQGR